MTVRYRDELMKERQPLTSARFRSNRNRELESAQY